MSGRGRKGGAPGEGRRALHALAMGLAVFAAGLALALRLLPAWRSGPVPDKAFFVGRYRELLGRAGLSPAGGEPVARLVTRGWTFTNRELEPVIDVFPGNASSWIAAHRRGLEVEVSQPAGWPGGAAGRLTVRFDLDGRPWLVEDARTTISGTLFGTMPSEEQVERLVALVLPPGARRGPVEKKNLFTHATDLYPVAAPGGPETVLVLREFGEVRVSRHLGEVAGVWAKLAAIPLRPLFLAAGLRLAGLLAIVGLVLFFLARRRLGAANGAILGGAVLAGLLLGGLDAGSPVARINDAAQAFNASLLVFLLWSAAESWARSAAPALTAGLDRLRGGVLGPPEGSALLTGYGVGAAAAGLSLIVVALGSRLVASAPPAAEGVTLPFFGQGPGSFCDPPVVAGLALLAVAAAARWLPARWAGAAGALLCLLFLGVQAQWLRPYPVTFAAIVPPALLMAAVGRRRGVAALLSAALSATALPAAALALLHASWLPGTLAVSGALALAIPAAGLVGISRPESRSDERLFVPKFVRRLEEERRVRYEMDLLARMQVGLLPEKPPRIPGYEIAARSLLANEAGGDLYDFLADGAGNVWIAAGDVSGHGYSCAIAQAMTKAALMSLVEGSRAPSEILAGADRVLRGGGSARAFTTLALLRLDPRTGLGALANAGHPYPYFVNAGRVEEIAVEGLPLGQGPPRVYRDRPVEIPPGGVLVFASDGLAEALGAGGEEYGFDRPREVLRGAGGGTAEAILDALISDWRRFLAGRAPADDTTIVVVKRAR